MGRVYLAQQVSLERAVVLKVLTGAPAFEDRPTHPRRFMLEAATCARLKHPNTVTIYDYGELELPEADMRLFYIAVAYVHGHSLDEHIKQAGRLSLGRSLWIVWEITRALRETHRKGWSTVT